MSHPKKSELLEYSKDLLSPEQKESIEEHIENCDSCRQEIVDSLALIEKLGSWQDIEIPEEYVDTQLQILDTDIISERLKTYTLKLPFLTNPYVRGALIAATAVLSTIAVQGLILNPLAIQKQIRTVFEIAPLPLAYPYEGAIPDTMIVLNVHEDGSYSTSVFEGVYSLEALKSQLAREVNKGEYWTLVVNATKLRSPISLRFKDLAFFRRKLGISEFRVWTDDILSRMTGEYFTMEELEEIVGAGKPRIEITLQGIDIKSLHQVSLSISAEGLITIYGKNITMAEAQYFLRNYHGLNPDGKLQIQYWESSISDSVKIAVKELAESVGISDITYLNLGRYDQR